MSTQGFDSMAGAVAREAVDLAISNARHAGFGTTGPGTRYYSTQAWLESDSGKAYLARKAGQAVKDLCAERLDASDEFISAVNWDAVGVHFMPAIG